MCTIFGTSFCFKNHLKSNHCWRFPTQNLSQIMTICLSESEVEARRKDEEVKRVAKTREAAEYLSQYDEGGENDNSNYYLQIADQTGKRIDLPKEERKVNAIEYIYIKNKHRQTIKANMFFL